MKYKHFFILIIVLWVGAYLLIGAVEKGKQKQEALDLKYDNCVTEMQQAIPDPNETDQRSTFLQECYEN